MAEEDIGFDSDDDINRESHNKLLSAVSRLYKKQRVENAKRTEPSREVSEFNLAAPGSDGTEGDDFVSKAITTVGIGDLLSTLNHSAKQKKIKSKMNTIKGLAATLPPPLEKNESEKIKRSVGYDNVKTHVSRWDGLVEKNQLSLQLNFPLPKPQEIVEYKPLSFASTFTKPNELELRLAEVLKESNVHKKEEAVEETLFKLSLKEMIQQRKLMKKIKAQESFKIIKAMKQNKIKSKKYRRLLRKEKAKEELKEFEALKATDPEAALEKLEKDERERALERASLRHRNTGRWAKGLAVRAKYDKEARKELADQVAKSREITRKKMLEEEGDEEDSNDEYSEKIAHEFGDNPWANGTTPDDMSVKDFMKGYLMYWKANKESETVKEKRDDSKVKGLIESEPAIEVSSSLVMQKAHNLPSFNNTSGYEDITIQKSKTKVISENTSAKVASSDEDTGKIGSANTFPQMSKANENVIVNSKSNQEKALLHGAIDSLESDNMYVGLSDNTDLKKKTEDKSPSIVKSLNKKQNVKGQQNAVSGASSISSSQNESDLMEDLLAVTNSDDQNTEEIIFSSRKAKLAKPILKKNSSTKMQRNIKTKRRKEGSWTVEEDDKNNDASNNSSKKTVRFSAPIENIDEDLKDIDKMFDNMENSIKEKVMGRVEQLKKSLEENDEDDDDFDGQDVNGKESDSEEDEFAPKRKKKKSNTIEINKEGTRESLTEDNNKTDGISDAIITLNEQSSVKDVEAKSTLINPNEYMVVQPRCMANEIGDISVPSELVDDGEDGETTEGNTAKDFEEAFADDDLVNDFRNEKSAAENVKHELDLTLPGWGSWGGSGINENSKKRRKRKRKFVLAFAPTNKPTLPKKDNVILNEDAEAALADLRVKQLPAPYSAKTFQMTMQVPLGPDWQSEIAVKALTQPPVTTRAGHIIKPMSEEQLSMYNTKIKTAIYDVGKKKSKHYGQKNKRKPLG